MMFFWVLFALLGLLWALPAQSLTYNWPLEENFGVSATFGESRGDHFHAGIDLSTNGDTGLPVLAVADGEIYRMKVQKRGYGRALYIRHPDGHVSVYGHLEGYSSELGLEQKYQQRIVETGTRYVGDIFIEPAIRVQQGTVVAFSGETGAGLPHLHLELRREENVPINPLANGFIDSTDPVPPAFQAVYLYPANSNSAVDGELETHSIKFQEDAGIYKADHIPVVRGDFYVSVSVYDSALRPYRRVPHKIALAVDGKLISQIQFDQFSYTEPENFGLLYDQGKPGPSYYELPIIMSSSIDVVPPFIRKGTLFSAQSLLPGLHRLELQAIDAANNTSSALMEFVVNHPPTLELKSISADASDLIVTARIDDPDWKGTAPSGFAGEIEYSLDNGQTFAPFPLNSIQLEGEPAVQCKVPLNSLGNQPVLIKARGFDGVEYSPYAVVAINAPQTPVAAPMTAIPQGSLKITPYGNGVRVVYDTAELITYPLQIQSSASSNTYPMESWNLTSYHAVLAAPVNDSYFTLTLNGGTKTTIPVDYATVGRLKRIARENYDLTLLPESLYRNSFVWCTSIPAYTAKYLYLVGPMVEFGPRGLPLKKDANLRFNFPANTLHPERLSIYRWNRFTQKWQSLPSKVNIAHQTVETEISYLDLYALIYDNVAPVIKQIFPRKNSTTRNETPKLAAEIRDSGMDVNDEKIVFYVDGIAYPAEYDPDRNLATVKIEKPLKKGSHSFRVTAEDWAGNPTESKKVFFRVR
ncbi:MAG TPA: M23 family metallopeptidase [Acidobacteriota bacterium]|nr:M23 family metallopeptidase [Acidobacteriota bacterium]